MSDLISRSKAISILKQLNEHSLTGKMDISNAIYLLENQPIAYDIDKVVEELEKKKEEVQRMRNTCIALSDLEVCDIENVTYKRAIEIVNQGGVADDVCNYFIKNKEVYAGCKKKPVASTFCWFNECDDYKYCPYCGKKVRSVE